MAKQKSKGDIETSRLRQHISGGKKLHLTNYQRDISDLSELSGEQVRFILSELLKKLDLKVIIEETPDYTALELVEND